VRSDYQDIWLLGIICGGSIYFYRRSNMLLLLFVPYIFDMLAAFIYGLACFEILVLALVTIVFQAIAYRNIK
jgi:hypothetical protein